MGDSETAVRRSRFHAGAGIVLAGAGFAAIFAGPLPLTILAGLLYLLAYVELRRILGAPGSRVTAGAGACALGGFVWVGHTGSPEQVPWVFAALVVGLFVLRILLVELRVAGIGGTADDVAATVAAAGIIGLLGTHVLLLRALPRFGFQAVLVFALMLTAHGLVGLLTVRFLGRGVAQPKPETSRWAGTAAGGLATLLVGVGAGLVPASALGVGSWLFLAGGVAVLAPVGDLTEDALKRSAGVQGSGGMRGFEGVLDVLDGPLFSAPFFYWALRAIIA